MQLAERAWYSKSLEKVSLKCFVRNRCSINICWKDGTSIADSVTEICFSAKTAKKSGRDLRGLSEEGFFELDLEG